jgi:Fur family ferric uptake transcriptional regulator
MPAEVLHQPATLDAMRSTRQRRAVVAVVNGLDGFASSQTIHEALTARGDKVGLSTVYRTLHALSDAGAVDWLRARDGELLYRKCGPQQHHHLVCHQCGHTVEITGSPMEDWARLVAADSGWAEVTYSIDVFGRCPACTRE